MMKRFAWLFLILVLSLPTVTQCRQQAQATPTAFDALARWVPGNTEQAFFMDLRPAGEMGRHWQRIRQRLEANPPGLQALSGIQGEFRVEETGLEQVIVGPAVNGYRSGTGYSLLQVRDGALAEAAVLQHFGNAAWEQVEVEDHTIYYGRNPGSWGGAERLAWAVHDEVMFLVWNYDGEALDPLQAMLELSEQNSLAGLPIWQTIRARLPETPLSLAFFNAAEQARLRPPSAEGESLGAAFGQRLEAVALAAVPEEAGMRVEITGVLNSQGSELPALQALLDLPTIDPTSWTSLPADTALAVFAHDASVVWPWLKDMLSINTIGLDQIRELIGLDMDTDLAGASGPLTGDLALAITPPLPNQPIIQGLTAAQLLIAARGASPAQANSVRTAMESRGAVFGPGEVEGIPIQTQAGTASTGYAISYGFDGDLLLMATSPDAIGQGVVARRAGGGLVNAQTFRAVLDPLPDELTFVVYLDDGALADLAQANMTADEYKNRDELVGLEAFEAIGLGLELQPDRFDGVVYFLVP
jgi:hypothetical protein